MTDQATSIHDLFCLTATSIVLSVPDPAATFSYSCKCDTSTHTNKITESYFFFNSTSRTDSSVFFFELKQLWQRWPDLLLSINTGLIPVYLNDAEPLHTYFLLHPLFLAFSFIYTRKMFGPINCTAHFRTQKNSDETGAPQACLRIDQCDQRG